MPKVNVDSIMSVMDYTTHTKDGKGKLTLTIPGEAIGSSRDLSAEFNSARITPNIVEQWQNLVRYEVNAGQESKTAKERSTTPTLDAANRAPRSNARDGGASNRPVALGVQAFEKQLQEALSECGAQIKTLDAQLDRLEAERKELHIMYEQATAALAAWQNYPAEGILKDS